MVHWEHSRDTEAEAETQTDTETNTGTDRDVLYIRNITAALTSRLLCHNGCNIKRVLA